MSDDQDRVLSYVVANPGTFKPLKVYPLIVFYSIYIVSSHLYILLEYNSIYPARMRLKNPLLPV
jgi:hypothetical protein